LARLRLPHLAFGCALLALALVSDPARAQEPSAIRVEREPGAEDCPDTADLTSRVAAVMGHPSEAVTTPYVVTFARTPQAYTAAIQAGDESATVRRLSAREPNCAALAHATTVALAVLLDADPNAPPGANDSDGTTSTTPAVDAVKPPASIAKHVAAPSAREMPLPSAREVPSWELAPFVSAGAGAAVGILRPVSLALVVDAGLELGRLRASVGALWLTPQTLELTPGSARESLLSGSLRLCLAVSRGKRLRLDACSGAIVGFAQAEAHGFVQNLRHKELFVAFPVGPALSVRTGPLSWELAASLLLVCPPNEFNVVGRGLTYQPPPVAGLFTLRASFDGAR
jgi:hypothetical protein